MFGWLSGIFLGFNLGANNTAAVFGTAVSSRMVSWRVAALLTGLCVLLGAVLQGGPGIETLRQLAPTEPRLAILATFAAAVVVGIMTWLRLPASASHAVAGAILGLGLWKGSFATPVLMKILVSWAVMPFGAMFMVVLLDWVLRPLFWRWCPSVFSQDPVIRAGLVLCGCYGAYALGANVSANVALVFVQAGGLEPRTAAGIAGLTIAAGALAYGRRVIATIGHGITTMNSFDAMVTVLGMGLTVHLFAVLGVPVSVVHAIVGAIAGRGLRRGMQTVKWHSVGRIGLTFLLVPLAAAALAILLYVLDHLKYIP